MEKYIICEALGYGKIGNEIEGFDSFTNLKKALLKNYKATRYLVCNPYCNFIYFSGLQVDTFLRDQTHPTKNKKTMNLSNLKEEFKDDFYHRDMMYSETRQQLEAHWDTRGISYIPSN